MRRLLPWTALTGGIVVVGFALGALGLPSPSLFGALLVGLAAALARPAGFAIPRTTFTAAQAVIGVVLGTYLQSSALSAVADAWLPVTLVGAATLIFSLGSGAVLARVTGVDEVTAALGLVAGGASGIVSMADDLGADDRLVAFMQYARVLVVVLLTPVLVAVAFPGHHAGPGGGAAHVPVFGDVRGWLLTLGVAAAGGIAAGRVRMPAASLLGPMILAGIITLAIPGGAFSVPPVVRELAFALIGVQVGLRFTVETVREVGRLLVPVLGCVFGLMTACAGLAVILDATTSVSLLDAYLATTPGGLYAVLAVAYGAGANTTFIIATQGLRLLVMVLLAPLAVRWLAARHTYPSQPKKTSATS